MYSLLKGSILGLFNLLGKFPSTMVHFHKYLLGVNVYCDEGIPLKTISGCLSLLKSSASPNFTYIAEDISKQCT